jgi:DNA polymerase
MNIHPLNAFEIAGTPMQQSVLHRDYEVRSTSSLQKVGAWKFAAIKETEVLCCAYAVNDGPVKLWLPGDPEPPEFDEAANNTDWLACAHNDSFETAIERMIMQRRFGWSKIPLQRHRCTMAMGLALALPGKLELITEALELIHQKDRAGQRLMLMMAKPRKPRKDEDPNEGPYWFDDEDRRQRLYEYCKQDVEVERELHLLQPLIPNELKLWQHNCIVNARGLSFRPCAGRSRAQDRTGDRSRT